MIYFQNLCLKLYYAPIFLLMCHNKNLGSKTKSHQNDKLKNCNDNNQTVEKKLPHKIINTYNIYYYKNNS